MDSTKIRVKFGNHEFEAEGPSELVKAQFDAFRELISSASPIPEPKTPLSNPEVILPEQVNSSPSHVPLERILHANGRIVSLTALPTATWDAALLIMLGHKDLRDHESVTSQELGDGLAQSGRPVPRVDRVMEKHISSAYILKSGFKRSTRYRLTNLGQQRALSIARDLIASLP